MKKLLLRVSLLLSVAIFLALGSPVLAQPPDQGAISAEALVQRLQQVTGNHVRIAYHRETGRVRFIGTTLDHAIAQPQLQSKDSPEAAARQFLADYGALFGLRDQTQELTVLKTRSITSNRSMIRFQQVYQGIPVVGGELIVQTDGGQSILSANGEVLPDIAVNTQPTITADIARQTALATVAKNTGLATSGLNTTTPELWLFHPGLLGGPGLSMTRLVWRLEVTAGPSDPVRELVLVDAHLGAVALDINQIHTARNRLTHTAGNTTTLPGTLVCNESSPNCAAGDSHAQAAHIYAGDTYDYYMAEHNRDSIDDNGETIISTVHYGSNFFNAFWNGTQMVYGDAAGFALADDVVGHELTHGVTERESHLFYYYQSGAINESFSDVWGEFIDLTNGAGNDAAGVRWQVGEDVTGLGAIRSMKSPGTFGDPDRISSPNYFCNQAELSSGAGDNGGVHSNSGVNNKAAYLMVDGTVAEAGGTFNGFTITGLGITKVADLYYEVQTNMLTSAADYADLYEAIGQAGIVLGYSAADRGEIQKAINAVEMNTLPAGCPNPGAPVCPAGREPGYVFFDNMESGAGRWTSSVLQGTSNFWFLPQTAPANTLLQDYYATSGVGNIWGFDQGAPVGGTSDTVMAMNQSVTLPAGAFMYFNHAFGFESDDPPTTGRYDGGIIEYSLNNGTSWQDASSLIVNNGYNGAITTGFGNPLAGRNAFTADSRGYISTRLNLSSLAGNPFRLRFRLATDSTVYDYGWFIDDVRIYACLENSLSLPAIRR